MNSTPSWRHHFVPRFLLAAFAKPTPHGQELWVFDSQRKKPQCRSPRGTGWAPNFYSVEAPGGPADTVEKFIAKVEGLAAPVIGQMIASQSLPTGADREHLLRFLGLMHGRTPTMRNALRDHYEGIEALKLRMMARDPRFLQGYYQRPAVGKGHLTPDEIEALADELPFRLTEESVNALAAQMAMTGMDKETLSYLRVRNWSLFFSEAGAPDFILGDSPLSISFTGDFARQAHADNVPPALIDPNTEVVLPLSRRAALVGRVDEPSQVEQLDSHGVTIVNSRTVFCAHRFLYSSNPDFVFWDLQNREHRSDSWLGRAIPTSDPI